MILINGKRESTLAVADRGLQYGDGLFETLAVVDGQPVYLDQHLQRLQQGCKRLLIPCPDLDVLAQESAQLSESESLAVLKIIITRGVGGRGYRQPETVSATRILSIHPYPLYPDDYKKTGIRARFCQTPLGMNCKLAGLKHLNRLEQVLARAEWQDPDIQEGLMLDVSGNVIEGTMSNLFFVKDLTLFTSPLTYSGIAGIIRERILQLARMHDIPIKEQYFMQETLLVADELFVTNSIIGLWPIRQLEQQVFVVGHITQQLQGCLERSL